MMRNNGNSQTTNNTYMPQPARPIITNEHTIPHTINSIEQFNINDFLTQHNLQNSQPQIQQTIYFNSHWDQMYELLNLEWRRLPNNLRLDNNLPMQVIPQNINFMPSETIFHNFFVGSNNQYIYTILRNRSQHNANTQNQLLLEQFNQNSNQIMQANQQLIEASRDLQNLNTHSSFLLKTIKLLFEKMNNLSYDLIISCSRIVGVENSVLYIFSIIKEWSPTIQYLTCICCLAGGTIILVGGTIYIIRKGHRLYSITITPCNHQIKTALIEIKRLLIESTKTILATSTTIFSTETIQNPNIQQDPIIHDNPFILPSTSPFARNAHIIADINKKRTQIYNRPKSLIKTTHRNISTRAFPLKNTTIPTRLEYYFNFLKQNKILCFLTIFQLLGLVYISMYENILFNFHTTNQPFKIFDWEITLTFYRILIFYFILNLSCFIIPLLLFHPKYQNYSLWITRTICASLQAFGSWTFLTNTATIIFKYGLNFVTPQDKINFLKNFYSQTQTQISLLIHQNKYFYLDLNITKEEKLQTLLTLVNEQLENLKILNPNIQLKNFPNFLEKCIETWTKNPKEFEKFFETTKDLKKTVNENILNTFFAQEYIQFNSTIETIKPPNKSNWFWNTFNQLYEYFIQNPYQLIGIISGIILLSYFGYTSYTTTNLIDQVGNISTGANQAINGLNANQIILKDLIIADQEKIENLTKMMTLLIPTVETNEKILKQIVLKTIGDVANTALVSQTGCQILTNEQLTKILFHLINLENGQNNIFEIIRYTLLADDVAIPYNPETNTYIKTIFQLEVEKFQTDVISTLKTKYPLIYEAITTALQKLAKITKEKC